MKFLLKASIAACFTFLLLGCGPTEEEKAAQIGFEEEQISKEKAQKSAQIEKDARKLCAEIGATTQGFSGPSKRIEIMKSYGIEPTEAQEFNAKLKRAAEAKLRAENLSLGFSTNRALREIYQRAIREGDCNTNAKRLLTPVSPTEKDEITLSNPYG